MPELHDLTALQQRDELRAGRVSPLELVEHYLARIDRLNPSLGALVVVTRDAARERAASLAPSAAPLWGMPHADKDLVARAGVPTRYGSRAFADFVPEASDDLALLLDDAGAISLGKTNTPEFGMTGYTESLVAPPARNPWDLSLGAGGSSGGAAAAVASGMLPFAVASDGGGSIRIPAASVGVVGLKPSRGRLPVGSGLDGFAGLAVSGPIARNVTDAALLLDALVEGRPYPFAVRAPGSGPFLPSALHPDGSFRVGVTLVSPWDDAEDIELDPAGRAAVEQAARSLGDLGHGVEDLDWRPQGYAELFTALWRGSAARIRVEDDRLHLVEPVTAWLIRSGRALGARALAEALAAASLFERQTIAAFAPYDAVLTPAIAQSPRPIGWFDAEDAERNFSQQVRYAPYTSFVNVAGLPAIAVPVARDGDGHPVSVQLVGRPGGEHALLALAAQLERTGEPLHPPGW
ncbi:amidase [soil metagenome]